MNRLFKADVGVNGEARIFIPGRPTLLNAERAGNWRQRHTDTKRLRETGRLAGVNLLNVKGHKFPPQALISSYPTYTTRRSWPDVGNWFPTSKAVIDGLVDAGAWPDDNSAYVTGLLFEVPRLGEHDGLFLFIHPSEGAHE